MPRRAAKIDKNQPEIVDALESNGYRVKSTAALPKFVDLVVHHDSWGPFVRLVEVKNGAAGRLTKDQRKFIADGWPVDVVCSTFEILELMKEWKR